MKAAYWITIHIYKTFNYIHQVPKGYKMKKPSKIRRLLHFINSLLVFHLFLTSSIPMER